MTTNAPPSPPTVAALLTALEELSRGRPDRVLRLRGRLRVDAEGQPVDVPATGVEPATGLLEPATGLEPAEPAATTPTEDPFELLIFRGFSSSVTHPTAFDPDRPALPEGAVIETAELLAGPLNPLQEQRLAGPRPVETFLLPEAW
ncbi:MAG: hypothetical protein FJ083_10675 [Cyanobacteria bacterium K_Offshore_surface_m2_239]|nr:hypothetical protein [Cyanobacteria bacterium K_Offshore_surface_m2_239]